MNFAVQRLCIYSGAASIVMFFAGAFMADFLPPPPPSMSVDEVVQFFQTDTNLKRLGMVLFVYAATLSCVFSVQISVFMRQIEGPFSISARVDTDADGTYANC